MIVASGWRPATRWRRPLRWALNLAGVGALAFIISTLDFGALKDTLRGANVWLLAGALAIGVPFISMKGLRWGRLLELLGHRLPWTVTVRLYAAGLFAGYATPGQVGEVAKVAYLERYGCPVRVGLLSIVGDRLIDVVFLALLALPGLGLFVPGFSNLIGGALSVALFVVGGLSLVLIARGRVLARIGTGSTGRALGVLLARLRSTGPSAAPSRRAVILVVVFAVVSQTILYGRLALALEAIHVEMSVHAFITGLAGVSLIAAMPISIAGIGTRDVAMIVLFDRIRLAREPAVVFSALILLLHLSNAAIGFIAWMVSAHAAAPATEEAPSSYGPPPDAARPVGEGGRPNA